jgi:hypothetical protein
MSEIPHRPQYEFDSRQSEVVSDLASGLRVVGLLLVILGILYLLGLFALIAQTIQDRQALGSAILVGVSALIALSLGVWFRRSAWSFQRIVETAGRDIDHLITALDELRKSFSLLRTIIVIYAVLILLGLIVGLAVMFLERSGAV